MKQFINWETFLPKVVPYSVFKEYFYATVHLRGEVINIGYRPLGYIDQIITDGVKELLEIKIKNIAGNWYIDFYEPKNSSEAKPKETLEAIDIFDVFVNEQDFEFRNSGNEVISSNELDKWDDLVRIDFRDEFAIIYMTSSKFIIDEGADSLRHNPYPSIIRSFNAFSYRNDN